MMDIEHEQAEPLTAARDLKADHWLRGYYDAYNGRPKRLPRSKADRAAYLDGYQHGQDTRQSLNVN